MKQNNPDQHKSQTDRRVSLIAGLLTLLTAGVVLVVLFVASLSYDRSQLAQASTPEIGMMEPEDEQFIEPMLVEDPGVQDAEEEGDPAPMLQGEPEPSEQESQQLNVNGQNTQPAPPEPKPVTQPKPSTVKVTEPPKTDKPDSKVTGKVSNAFSTKNGASDGKPNATGTGGTGTSQAKGFLQGNRKMESCPTFKPQLSQKYVIVVDVTVKADGTVSRCKARQSSAPAALAAQCEAAAKKSKWTKKAGAEDAFGTITFTLTPKK